MAPTLEALTPRQKLLQLQKETFAHLEEIIKNERLEESPELRKYRKAYEREIRGYRKLSNKKELTAHVIKSSIVFCGDYHTLRQAQRTALKILTSVQPYRPSIYLGLELIPKSREKLANDFIRRRVTESQFLADMEYHQRWGFPWDHYRDLFLFAREHNIRVLALNPDLGDKMSLQERDKFAASILANNTLSHPETLIFCLYGDLHIASSHIPYYVKNILKESKTKRKTLTIFQNSDPIYWKLASQDLEHEIDVVEISSNTFCILSAAPWVKWQSYHSWVEDQSDLLEFPEEYDSSSHTPDYYHQVLDFAESIGGFLGVHPRGLEQFSIYTADDSKIIDAIDKYCEACDRKGLPITSVIRSEIIENGSSFFPELSILYLSDLSQNRAYEKAAQLLATKLEPSTTVFGFGKNRQEIFYRLVLWEAIGFLGSKFLNPKRRCAHYMDLEKFLQLNQGKRLRGHLKNEKLASQTVLMHQKYENSRLKTKKKRSGRAPQKVYTLTPKAFYRAAQILGYILADRLYVLLNENKIDLKVVQDLFSSLREPPPHAEEEYWRFASLLLEKEKTQPPSKDDRF